MGPIPQLPPVKHPRSLAREATREEEAEERHQNAVKDATSPLPVAECSWPYSEARTQVYVTPAS